MPSFVVKNINKIVGLDFEKFDKVYFRDKQTHTDMSDLIGPSN